MFVPQANRGTWVLIRYRSLTWCLVLNIAGGGCWHGTCCRKGNRSHAHEISCLFLCFLALCRHGLLPNPRGLHYNAAGAPLHRTPAAAVPSGAAPGFTRTTGRLSSLAVAGAGGEPVPHLAGRDRAGSGKQSGYCDPTLRTVPGSRGFAPRRSGADSARLRLAGAGRAAKREHGRGSAPWRWPGPASRLSEPSSRKPGHRRRLSTPAFSRRCSSRT